ncbi:Zn-ribbon domain-containing OB-fold protein [Actinomycetospora sp. C-140]
MPDSVLAPGAWRRDGADLVLLATRCRRCGERTFPPVRACPRCWGTDLAEVPLPRRGTVHALTVTHVAADGIAAPYAVAYVDLPDGSRLCGRLERWDGVRPGDAVEAVGGVLRDGPAGTVTGWLFRPVGADP